jgi:phage baseplate assembly protein gpV
LLRFGRISDIDADKGLCKVSFGEDNVVTDWIPTIHNGTSGNSYFHTFDINEHVACMMSDNGITGVILGAIYSKNLQPIESGEDVVSVVFNANNKIVFNRQTGEMEIKASGGVTINGDLTVQGSVDASGDVTAGLTNISLTGHTHEVVVTGNPETATTNPPL